MVPTAASNMTKRIKDCDNNGDTQNLRTLTDKGDNEYENDDDKNVCDNED